MISVTKTWESGNSIDWVMLVEAVGLGIFAGLGGIIRGWVKQFLQVDIQCGASDLDRFHLS